MRHPLSHSLSRPLSTILCLTLAAALLGGCVSTPKPHGLAPNAKHPADQTLSAGYTLLYSLVSKEQNVSTILYVKSVSKPTKKIIDAIAKQSQQEAQQLENAKGIRTDLKPLPKVEQKTRASIKSDQRNLLLFTSDHFERDLLLGQAKATQYGQHLAQALQKMDTDDARVSSLKKFAKQFKNLHKRVVNRLTVVQDNGKSGKK